MDVKPNNLRASNAIWQLWIRFSLGAQYFWLCDTLNCVTIINNDIFFLLRTISHDWRPFHLMGKKPFKNFKPPPLKLLVALLVKVLFSLFFSLNVSFIDVGNLGKKKKKKFLSHWKEIFKNKGNLKPKTLRFHFFWCRCHWGTRKINKV